MASIIYKGDVSTGGGGGSTTWQEKTADFTAQSGYGYFVDSTSPVIVTLPASASIGDTFYVVNVSGSVAFGGLIQGSVSPSGILYKGTVITEQICSFYYLDAIYGWFCDKNLVNIDVNDPYYSSVVLYLRGDGANGSTTIVDESPTPKTISVFGDAQISTAQSKYGGSSIYFDGTGDYLSVDNSSIDFNLDGDFTIEGWLFTSRGATLQGLISLMNDSLDGSIITTSSTGNKIALNYYAGGGLIDNIGTNDDFTLSGWNHFAFVKNGSNLSSFLNGVLQNTKTSFGSWDLRNYPIQIGRWNYTVNYRYLQGYIDSLRITKGVARYTANFDPETDTYLAY